MAQFPEHFGKYVLLRKIAKGGMAEIFLAKNVGAEGFEKDLVIKRILPHYSEDEEFVTMFIDEASIASKLQHANVVQIYDFNQIEGSYYIAMEYVNGKDLKDVIADGIRRRKPLSPAQSVSIIIELAKALHYAHTKTFAGTPLNIVHRDVSPQNAMISFGGEVKLMDFGIAKAASRSTHTVAGTVKGKCAYMSPEQAKGKALDGRSDMFALGVVLWEMLTAKRLFLADSDFMTLTNVLKQEAPPPSSINPDVPPELDLILLKALEKDRDDRYADAQAFERALTRWFYGNADLDAARLSPYMTAMYASDIAVNKAKATEERTMFLQAADPDAPAGNPPPAPDEATRALPSALYDPQAMSTMNDGQIGPGDVAHLRQAAAAAGTITHDDATRMLDAMPSMGAAATGAPDQATRMLDAMPSMSPVGGQTTGAPDEATRMLDAMPSLGGGALASGTPDQATRMLDAMPDDIRDLRPPARGGTTSIPVQKTAAPQSSKAWLWMTLVLVVLAISGGVAAWYFLAGPGKSEPKVAANTDTPDATESGSDAQGASVVAVAASDAGATSGEEVSVAAGTADGAEGKTVDVVEPVEATDGDSGTAPEADVKADVAAAAASDAGPEAAGTDVQVSTDAVLVIEEEDVVASDVAEAADTAVAADTTGPSAADAVVPVAVASKTQILVQCDPDGQVSADVGTVEHQGMMWVIKDVEVGKPVKIKCYRSGYATQAQDVVAQNGLNIPFKLQRLSAGYGSIRVNAKPWARCSVASKKNATTPVKIPRVKAGRYRVVCKFKDQTKKSVITVKANRQARKLFNFKKK